MKAFRIPLRIVFYRCDGQWVSHCLEFDLCGHGVDQQQAIHRLAQTVRIQLNESMQSGNLRNLFTPADSDVFEMFVSGQDTAAIASDELSMTVDGVQLELSEAREYGEDSINSDARAVASS